MPLKVTLIPSGREFEAEPGERILDAARRGGLDLPHSCRRGNCLACRARVVKGSVEYAGGSDAALSEADRRNGYALLCQAAASGPVTLDVPIVSPAGAYRIRRLPCRIEQMEALTSNVIQLFLKVPQAAGFTFAAGQYIDFILDGGKRRSFSLANSPEADLIELHIRHRAGGEFSEQLFGGLVPSDVLRIEGPLGSFFLRDAKRPMIFVAGGTGYAPLKAMLRTLIDNDNSIPVRFYWGARVADDLYDSAWMQKHADRFDWLDYVPVISDDGTKWQGRTGLVNDAVIEDQPDLSKFDIYTSGPPAMVYAGQRDFPKHGLKDDRLFFDAFDYAPDYASEPGSPG